MKLKTTLLLVVTSIGFGVPAFGGGAFMSEYRARLDVALKVVTPEQQPFPPLERHLPLPAYPAGFVRAGISGMVVFTFDVHSDGSVQNIEIVESSAPEFKSAVEAALRTWSFAPLAENGKDHPSCMSLRGVIRFGFTDDPVEWPCGPPLQNQ